MTADNRRQTLERGIAAGHVRRVSGGIDARARRQLRDLPLSEAVKDFVDTTRHGRLSALGS